MRQSQPPSTQSSLGRMALPAMLALIGVIVLGGLVVALREITDLRANPQPDPVAAAPSGKLTLEDKTPPPGEDGENLMMGPESHHSTAFGIATAVVLTSQGGTGALAELAMLKLDPGSAFWVAEDRGGVPLLNPELLRFVRDQAPILPYSRNPGEMLGYCDTLIKANKTPADIFARNARKDLTFVHLFEEPSRYRGDVVHIKGQLRLIKRFDPPAMAKQAGVEDLYECWIFDDQVTHPYCVLLTDLPSGIKNLGQTDHRVSFDGYFFKRYRYKAKDSLKQEQFRDAPLLIGKTLTVHDVAAPADDWSVSPLAIILSLIGGTILVVGGLTWWYRREDWRIQSRLAALCKGEFVLPMPSAHPPIATPVAGPVLSSKLSASEPTPHTHGHGHNKVRAVHRALGQGGIDSS